MKWYEWLGVLLLLPCNFTMLYIIVCSLPTFRETVNFNMYGEGIPELIMFSGLSIMGVILVTKLLLKDVERTGN